MFSLNIIKNTFYQLFVYTFQDVFQLHTPGGGGYGSPDSQNENPILGTEKASPASFIERGSVYEYRQAQESV